MKPNLSELMPMLQLAAREAGDEVLDIYNSEDVGIEYKGDKSPLTKADRASHEVLVKHLSSTELPILSEEGRDIPFEERSSWDYFWMIDPLDGTKEFIKRNGEFTINIALIEKNKPILGVVFTPVLDQLYFGDHVNGAFKDSNGEIVEIKTSKPDLSSSNLKVVASRSHLNEETEDFLKSLNDPEILSMGSSLKFMLVAEGRAHLYPRYAPTMEWDTAAAQAIVEAAGGHVYQEPGRNPMVYNKENLLNPHFLVTG